MQLDLDKLSVKEVIFMRFNGLVFLVLLCSVFVFWGCPDDDEDDDSGGDTDTDTDMDTDTDADTDADTDTDTDSDADSDTDSDSDGILGSCDAENMCSEYYASPEAVDTIMPGASDLCNAAGNTWQEDTECSDADVLATCHLPYEGIDAYAFTYCYTEAGVMAMKMMCEGEGAEWTEY